jgi:hypothetical protein
MEIILKKETRQFFQDDWIGRRNVLTLDGSGKMATGQWEAEEFYYYNTSE